MTEVGGRDTSVVVAVAGRVASSPASDPIPDVAPWPVPTADRDGRSRPPAPDPVRRVDIGRQPRAMLLVERVRAVDGDASSRITRGVDLARGRRQRARPARGPRSIVGARRRDRARHRARPADRRGSLLRPLDRVVDAAQRISAGDRAVRVGRGRRSHGDRPARGRVRHDGRPAGGVSAEAQRRFVADASHELRTPLGRARRDDRDAPARHRPGGRGRGRTGPDRDASRDRAAGAAGDRTCCCCRSSRTRGGRLPLRSGRCRLAEVASEVVRTMARMTDGPHGVGRRGVRAARRGRPRPAQAGPASTSSRTPRATPRRAARS